MSKAMIPAAISAVAGIGGALISSGKGGGSGGVSMQTQQSQNPGWVDNAAMQNYGDATKASYELAAPYAGQRVADVTPQAGDLISYLTANVGSTNPAFNQAGAATGGLMGYNPSLVTPQNLGQMSLAPYMNPYTQSVIDPSMKLLEQQRRQGINQAGDQAIGAKAFGGSRLGVTEGVTNAQSALNAGQLGASLWGQNFGQAQAAATGDIQRDMQAQQLNQSAGIQGAQFRGNMANQLAGLATQGQNTWLAGLNAAMGGQNIVSSHQQQQLDAAQALYNEQKNYPLQQIAIRQNALAQSPYGKTSYSSQPGPTTDPMMTGLGTAATVAGLGGQLGLWGGKGGGGGLGIGGGGGALDPRTQFTGTIGDATLAYM